jgi:hypothetical protein
VTPDLLQILAQIVGVLESLGVPYCVGGSVASSLHGVARSTLDVDIVADLAPHHAAPLVKALQETFYIDQHSVLDAIVHRGNFNLIHFETALKVDVFVLKDRKYEQEAFARRIDESMEEGSDAKRYSIERPEDTVLHKLLWYKKGDGVSERQWKDVQGVLRVQADALDVPYMRKWAPALGLAGLLAKALQEAGFQEGDVV